MVTVGRGDTVYELAQRYNVPMREVIELNRLSPPYALAVGQRLRLPTARFYTVQRGDTMYGISRMHQVGMSELARANGLQEPYAIRVGQQLQLPRQLADVRHLRWRRIQGRLCRQRPASTPVAPPAAARPTVVAEALPEAPQQTPLPPAVSAPARALAGAIRAGPAPAPVLRIVQAPIQEPVPAPVRSRARAESVQPLPSRHSRTAHLSRQPAACPAAGAQSGGGIAAAAGHDAAIAASLPIPFPRFRRVRRSRHQRTPGRSARSRSGRLQRGSRTSSRSAARSTSSTCGSGGSQAAGDRGSGAPWRKPVPVAATRRDPVRLRPQARRSA